MMYTMNFLCTYFDVMKNININEYIYIFLDIFIVKNTAEKVFYKKLSNFDMNTWYFSDMKDIEQVTLSPIALKYIISTSCHWRL